MPTDAEVVVVGGGVMGLATARALAREGRDVLLIEQFDVGHGLGSSHGGSRIFRLSYPDSEWVRLAMAALPLWRELEVEVGETLLESHGTLDFGDWAPNRSALAANGVAYEVLGAAALERRFPLIVGEGEQALHQTDGGIIVADRAQQALLASGAAAGVRLLEDARVTALQPEGERIRVETAGDAFLAAAAVVTAGAWARGLLEPLGLELDVVATRETVSYFELEGAAPSVIDPVEGRGRGQLGYALVAPGKGLKAGIHHSGPIADPDESGVPDPALAEWTADWVERRFRGVAATGRTETCLYTNTGDESFVLERHGRVVVGSPCSGHGFKFAPLVGRTLAGLVGEII